MPKFKIVNVKDVHTTSTVDCIKIVVAENIKSATRQEVNLYLEDVNFDNADENYHGNVEHYTDYSCFTTGKNSLVIVIPESSIWNNLLNCSQQTWNKSQHIEWRVMTNISLE